jgi:hypothetical protein
MSNNLIKAALFCYNIEKEGEEEMIFANIAFKQTYVKKYY